ncbi:MAG: 5-formyltetrahydrofolate cyclo-ligase [Methanobrevibacter sp.]|jgi:5-formyltetrahydrofolate cyclo-ligase|nr:5-formyltetrahydrofolate cyclo-ligase [Methanobrevibacter sp.]
MNIIEQKEILRKSVYDSIFNGGFSNRSNGDYGKIPDFKGSDIAAQTLAKSKEWKKSKTIFVSPDSAQTPVRYLALKDNKNLIMASPNLEHGYYFLDGSCLDGVEMEASTKEGALKYKIDDDSKHHHMSVDLLVEGSVAVDREGHRIGKGKGYGDREIADLLERKLIKTTTPLATTIHPLQLVDFVPTEDHDQKLNMVVTTEEIIRISHF